MVRLLESAVLIERHKNKFPNRNREINTVFVLMSVMQGESETIIPVQFEIEEYKKDGNRLYLAVALTKIETSVMAKTRTIKKQFGSELLPVSIYNITDIFKNINKNDYKFLKYIPDRFIPADQIEAKKHALEEDNKKSLIHYQDRNLIAVHNLSEEKLLKSSKLGGFPMPSIAVTKHDLQHTGFGYISLIFGKDTINPDVNSENKVYGGDAWTPMYPTVEYEADSKKSVKLYERAREAVKDGEIEKSCRRQCL